MDQIEILNGPSDGMEGVQVENETKSDSITLGSASKGIAIKVYFDASNFPDSLVRIRNGLRINSIIWWKNMAWMVSSSMLGMRGSTPREWFPGGRTFLFRCS